MPTQTFTIQTPSRDAMLNITSHVMEVIDASDVKDGWAHVFIPHTTAGVTINENADPDVIHDILTQLDTMVPHDQRFYRHNEGNSAAHVKSSMMGCSLIIPVADGRVALGQWQSIFFCEFDGPRTRRVHVSVHAG